MFNLSLFTTRLITVNGVAHGMKNHRVDGKRLTKTSIPISKQDAELTSYIMFSSDYG